MSVRYARPVAKTILQVRDIPESVVAKLRARAAEEGISLSAYVRRLLTNDARQETISEVIERISNRAPVEVSDEEIVSAIRDGQR
jgi:plasmid stability protein